MDYEPQARTLIEVVRCLDGDALTLLKAKDERCEELQRQLDEAYQATGRLAGEYAQDRQQLDAKLARARATVRQAERLKGKRRTPPSTA